MVPKPGEYLDVLSKTSSLEWHQLGDEPEGVMEAILHRHDDGSYTHVVRIEGGTVLPAVVTHEFYEEAYYIEGSMLNTQTKEVISGGTYVFHEPGEKHGPFKCLNTCLILEHRYYK